MYSVEIGNLGIFGKQRLKIAKPQNNRGGNYYSEIKFHARIGRF
jgi:hypothetical protein